MRHDHPFPVATEHCGEHFLAVFGSPISYFANIKTMSVDGMGWKGLGSCFVITKMSAQELPVHFLLL